jgi:hypothetical protein
MTKGQLRDLLRIATEPVYQGDGRMGCCKCANCKNLRKLLYAVSRAQKGKT